MSRTLYRFAYTPTLTLEDRSMQVLECFNTPNVKLFSDEAMPGPVFEFPGGERRSLDDWGEFDWLSERGFIEVDEEAGVVGPTWKGIKALRKWQRKYGR